MIFCSKTYFEKSCLQPLYHEVLFTVFMRCRMFETVMIHQSSIYINIQIINDKNIHK